jgi:H/ACA ribonucleoprotein complex subunit 4
MKDLLNFSLINIDKSAGPTSYSVSEFVQRQLGLSKTSHMGTLDPKVTGVLPVTLGRACKLADYFIKHDKTYVGVLHTHREQDIKELQKLIDENFTGKIKQTPPHRSAVKVQERERTVYSWKLIEASEDKRDFLFETRVEGGTYIRKLCSDLGEMIGGAHMGELRRTEAGIFDESTLVNLFDFKSAVDKYKNGNEDDLKKMLVPAEEAIKKVLPVVEVDKSAVKALHIGKPLLKSNVIETPKLKDGDVFAAFCGKQFIGVYKRGKEKVTFGRSEFVFS